MHHNLSKVQETEFPAGKFEGQSPSIPQSFRSICAM